MYKVKLENGSTPLDIVSIYYGTIRTNIVILLYAGQDNCN